MLFVIKNVVIYGLCPYRDDTGPIPSAKVQRKIVNPKGDNDFFWLVVVVFHIIFLLAAVRRRNAKSTLQNRAVTTVAPVVAEAQRIGGHYGKADEGYHKGNHQVDMVGYQPHQQKATAADGSHHQQRRGALGVGAESAQRQGEDGGKHDGFEEIDGYQRHHRYDAYIGKHQRRTRHSATAASQQHGLCRHAAQIGGTAVL